MLTGLSSQTPFAPQPSPEIGTTGSDYSYQPDTFPKRAPGYPVNYVNQVGFLPQSDDLLERQRKLAEKSFVILAAHVRHYTQLQFESGKIERFAQTDTTVSPRLTGPIQFILKLLECWNLTKEDAVGLLGFEETESDFVGRVLEGKEQLRGRDARDRISHLFSIRKALRFFFRDPKAENEWLRERQSMLEGRIPMSMLLRGPMEDILMVREYVDTMVGR